MTHLFPVYSGIVPYVAASTYQLHRHGVEEGWSVP